MFKPPELLKGLNQTVGGQRAHVAILVGANWVSVRSVIAAGLLKRERTVIRRYAMCMTAFLLKRLQVCLVCQLSLLIRPRSHLVYNLLIWCMNFSFA